MGGRVGQLELDQDLEFQSREWKIQRVGWAVMVLLALAALLGIFGRGPLTRSETRSVNGALLVEYERVVRQHAPTRLIVQLPRSSGETGIWFDEQMLDDFELQSMVPQPARTASNDRRLTFYFQVEPGARLQFLFEPQKIGPGRFSLGLASDTTSVRLRQLVLP